MRCPNCAKLIAEISHECPYCHEKLNIENVVYKPKKRKEQTGTDVQNNMLTYIFAFIPFGGLLYFLSNKEQYPLKSECALKGFKYNTTMLIIFIVLLIIAKIF